MQVSKTLDYAVRSLVHIAEGADVLAQHTDTPAMLQTAEE